MLKSYPNNITLPQTQAANKRPHTQRDDSLPVSQSRWRSLWASRYFMHYHRLIALVIIVNLGYLWLGLQNGNGRLSLATLSNFIITNFFIAIIIRQQLVINLLFKVATSIPTNWPLAMRRVAGKVYHFGGIHVGGTVVGTLWFAAFVVSLTARWLNGAAEATVGLMAITYTLLAILLLMIGMSMPQFRAKYHNQFELMHRFGGWTALLLFWAQAILFSHSQNASLLTTPNFWMLLLITISIILPWLKLKKVTVNIENPSSHVALVKFDHGVTPFAGSSTAVSRSPLTEWHSFANVPSPHEEGFRLTISRAGDWTGQFIDDLPEKVWVKGIPTAGVGNIDKLFKRVVWIATGSGIGPTLPHLLAQEVPAHLVWSTRTPRQTYGDDLVDEILAVEPDALIWDTNENGRPDLVQLAYDAVQKFDAEAVIVIANKKLTWQVVSGLESRGIPAYGAIWDS